MLAVLSQVTAKLRAEEAILSAARERLAEIDVMIRAEERRLRELRRRSEARRAVIDARARALYMAGSIGGLDPSGSETLDDYMMRASVIDYVAAFDRQVIEELRTLKDEARKSEAALAVQRQAASKQEDEIAERVAVVRELWATQQQAHAKLSSRIADARAEVAALEAEQARIQSIIAERSQGGGSVSTGGSSAYGFAWPIRGSITSPYGPRWGSFHTGIDIDCQTGDGIGASKEGRVIAAEWGGGYGNMVIIDHGGGYTTLYAHMSGFSVSRGEKVSKHERVGSCGATGNSTGDHLHFEVRVNGNHRNPMDYLP